jgi:hypothetical protein
LGLGPRDGRHQNGGYHDRDDWLEAALHESPPDLERADDETERLDGFVQASWRHFVCRSGPISRGRLRRQQPGMPTLKR